jgi:hypothetical protein
VSYAYAVVDRYPLFMVTLCEKSEACSWTNMIVISLIGTAQKLPWFGKACSLAATGMK